MEKLSRWFRKIALHVVPHVINSFTAVAGQAAIIMFLCKEQDIVIIPYRSCHVASVATTKVAWLREDWSLHGYGRYVGLEVS